MLSNGHPHNCARVLLRTARVCMYVCNSVRPTQTETLHCAIASCCRHHAQLRCTLHHRRPRICSIGHFIYSCTLRSALPFTHSIARAKWLLARPPCIMDAVIPPHGPGPCPCPCPCPLGKAHNVRSDNASRSVASPFGPAIIAPDCF